MTDNGNGTYSFTVEMCLEGNTGSNFDPLLDEFEMMVQGATVVAGSVSPTVFNLSGYDYNMTLQAGNTVINYYSFTNWIGLGSDPCLQISFTTNGLPSALIGATNASGTAWECINRTIVIGGAISTNCTSTPIFTDPGGNGNYPANSASTTTICPDSPGGTVSVAFSSFDIDDVFGNCLDQLIIYNGSSPVSSNILGGPFCNANYPGNQTFTSTSIDGCLTFSFQSDGSSSGSGWSATVSCTGGCSDPGNCDDGNCANGTESWDSNSCQCVPGTPPVNPGCNDGDCSNGIETWDGCQCIPGTPPVDPGCNDGDCSNGVETWDGCQCIPGTPPVDPGCNDGDCSNGVETWDGCQCIPGTPPVDPGCNDGDCSNGVETWDGCQCIPGTPPVDPGCNDGDCSNGVETWDGCQCVPGTPPVNPGCNDGDCSNGVETWDGCQCIPGTPPVKIQAVMTAIVVME
ncbi:MAG: CUB domain-containing protein [Chitinophagales bacterium]